MTSETSFSTSAAEAPGYGVVTIACLMVNSAAMADGLATLTMVPGCEGYFVTKSLEVIRTTGFAVA